MTICPDCPHLFAHRADPGKTLREECCGDVDKRKAEVNAGPLESPSNMMVNDLAKPIRSPRNRAERRAADAKQRRRQP